MPLARVCLRNWNMRHASRNLRARLGTRMGCRLRGSNQQRARLGPKTFFGARGDCRPARAVKLRTRDAAATQHFGRTHPRPARCLSRDAVGRPRPPVPASPTRLKGHEQREAWTAGKRCGEGKIDATLRETHVALAQPQGEVCLDAHGSCYFFTEVEAVSNYANSIYNRCKHDLWHL